MGKGTSATYNPANSCPVLARMTGADGYVPPGQEFVLGKDDYGSDFKVFGATSGAYMLFDESADKLMFEGADLQLNDSDELRFGDLAAGDIVAKFDGSNLSLVPATDAEGFLIGADSYTLNVTLKGTLTVGQSDTGHDVTLYGATGSNYLRWDESVDSLLLVGTAAKFSLGSFTGASSGTGSALSATNTAAFRVYADDGGAAIGSGSLVRAGWFRNLQTYTTGNREQESSGVQGSLVSVAGTNRHNMSGVLGSYEARTSLTVGGQAATTDTWCQAAVLGRVGAANNILTIGTNGVLAGVAAMSNVTTALAANSGVYAGFYVGKWGGATGTDSWSHGIYIQALAVDKAIQVGELSSTVNGSGVALTNSVTRVMEVHADDNNAARTAGIMGRAIFGRTMIYANTTQENWGIDGLTKWSGVAHTGNVNAGVVGRFEAIGTCSTATGSGNTWCAGVMGRVGSATTGFTIGSGTQVAGVLAFYNTSTTNAFTNTGTCAFLAVASEIAGTGNWDYGLYIQDVVRAGYIICELSGSAALNALELTVGEATTPADGYAHGIHVTYNKSGVDTGSGASTMQFNAIGVDYTVSGAAGNAAGYYALYAYVMKSGSPDLADCAIYGANLEMTEMGATDYFGCLWLNKYNTTKGTVGDSFIHMANQGSGVTRTCIFMQGSCPDYFLQFSVDTSGFLDNASGASATCNGHIEVRTSAGSKYLRLYDGVN